MTAPEGRARRPRLQGQVAVVTGAGCSHARAIALALAGSGAAVAVVDTSHEAVAGTAARIEAAGGRAFGFVVAADDAAAVGRLIAHVEQRLGPVDVLVHRGGPTWETMRGAVLPAMVARGLGRLIDISAGAADAGSPELGREPPPDTRGVASFALDLGPLTPEASAGLVLALAAG